MRKLTDEELVEKVRSEDQELYVEVVGRYQDKLMRYATYLVKDNQEAQDVVQGSFIKAFKNLRGFDIRRKFSSWIYRIVHNEAMNIIRRNKKFVKLDENWDIEGDSNIEEELTEKEARKMMRGAVEKLPIKYREPLVLYYIDERSYGEIGDVLRMPIGTVGTRINRAKILLRKIYEQEEN